MLRLPTQVIGTLPTEPVAADPLQRRQSAAPTKQYILSREAVAATKSAAHRTFCPDNRGGVLEAPGARDHKRCGQKAIRCPEVQMCITLCELRDRQRCDLIDGHRLVRHRL